LSFANPGDTILVAQGIYTDNIYINEEVTLMGGYAATSPVWIRNTKLYQTIIYSENRGTPGEWDGDRLGTPSVLKDGDTYKMWYMGGNELEGDSIGYADSPDGVNWFSPSTDPLISVGSQNEWDGFGVTAPFVMKTSIGFQMWYVGRSALDKKAIGIATSSDGLTWQKYTGNPILDSSSGSDDTFGFPSILQEDSNSYKMWYSEGGRIWLATSSDSFTWTKYGSDPVLSSGPNGSWDEARVYAPLVITSQNGYEMWYTAESWTSGPRIGYANSTDGINWTKSTSNPILVGDATTWDEDGIAYPSVILDGTTAYQMWYMGKNSNQYAYGYATSNNGTDWIKYTSNPVLDQGKATKWGGSVVALSDQSGAAVIDGFIITGGIAEYGGGIYSVGNQVTIRNCSIINNIARSSAGGFYIYTGSPSIENSTIMTNTTVSGWAGGIYAGNATLTISNTVIAGNVSTVVGGGFVVRSDSNLDLLNSAVSDNVSQQAGGIYLTNNSSLQATNSWINKNIAGRIAGVRIESGCTVNMTNTFVVDNQAVYNEVGGISFNRSNGRLVNVTVAGNSAFNNPVGIRFTAEQPEETLSIINSILFFNGTDDLNCSENSCSVTYSDVQEVISGPGNISEDPRFVDMTTGDFHLQTNSPVINKGTSDGAPLYDFEGDPRPIGAVDIGADELVLNLQHQVFVPIIIK
jgi:hypothetical protein